MRVGRAFARQRLGQQQRLAERVARRIDDIVGRDRGEPRAIACAHRRIGERLPDRSQGRAPAATSRAESSTRVQAPLVVGREQPAADREGRDAEDHAVVDQRELGGAAADVDMQHALVALLRQPHRARAVRGERAFELVAGGGADELAGLVGEQFVDRARVRPLDRLAGEDHGAAVDVARAQSRPRDRHCAMKAPSAAASIVPSGRNGVSMIGERHMHLAVRPRRSGSTGPATGAAAAPWRTGDARSSCRCRCRWS